MSQYTPQLGRLPGPNDRRDAIHVAIAPVVADCPLCPGDHVGPTPGGRFAPTAKPIGIVDPFLREAVQPGQMFWLCLYQGSITTLRHVWSHPAFTTRAPEAKP